MIKAIETQYNGYRFRSRLEARWAVFFDTLGITYEYEKEGYDLDGTWYLPDFWLPDLKLWVETKGELTWIRRNAWQHKDGSWYTVDESPELQLCEKFKEHQEWPMACIVGYPGAERIYFYAWDMTDSSGGSYSDDDSRWCTSEGRVTLDVRPGRSDRDIHADNLCGIYMPWFTDPFQHGSDRCDIERAYEAAKAARFEYGESGAPQHRRHVIPMWDVKPIKLEYAKCPLCSTPVFSDPSGHLRDQRTLQDHTHE
jgi:hypothetical protein